MRLRERQITTNNREEKSLQKGGLDGEPSFSKLKGCGSFAISVYRMTPSEDLGKIIAEDNSGATWRLDKRLETIFGI